MPSKLITVLALLNNMVGSAILLIPLQFLKGGIVNSIIIIIISAIFAFYSSKITYDHIN